MQAYLIRACKFSFETKVYKMHNVYLNFPFTFESY